MPFLAVGEDLPGRDVHRGEQVGGAVALVVVGHRPGTSRDHRQARLGPVHCLALGLLVEAEHHCAAGRVQVHPDDGAGFSSNSGSVETLNVSTFHGVSW